jgi:membrane-bound inhibitor of C-type lysozyme
MQQEREKAGKKSPNRTGIGWSSGLAVREAWRLLKFALCLAAVFIGVATAGGGDLTLHLQEPVSIVRRYVTYQCDTPQTSGLPHGPFEVEYVNDGVNSLAIVPIASHSVVFSVALSDAGQRFQSGAYVWQDIGKQGAWLRIKHNRRTRQYPCRRLRPVIK